MLTGTMVELCFSVFLLFFGGLGTDGWVVFQCLYGFLRSFEKGLWWRSAAMASYADIRGLGGCLKAFYIDFGSLYIEGLRSGRLPCSKSLHLRLGRLGGRGLVTFRIMSVAYT